MNNSNDLFKKLLYSVVISLSLLLFDGSDNKKEKSRRYSPFSTLRI